MVRVPYASAQAASLTDVHLDIPAGHTVALVGSTGSGKSTLIKILRRQFPIKRGTVLIDGQDIATATWDSVHDAFAEVPQNPGMFHRSVRDNIAFGLRHGRQPYDDAEINRRVEAAIVQVGLSQFAHHFPSQLSGGMRQRVSIARAILADPRILILDEATSALDPESEALVNANLLRIARGRTMVIVSHRLSSLTECDQILVLDRGRIHIAGVALGMCDRLIEESLRYAMERKQFQKAIAEFQLVQAMLADSKTEALAAFHAGEANFACGQGLQCAVRWGASRSAASRLLQAVSLIGVSLPTFLIGILLILLFAVILHWLPAFGRGQTVTFGWWTTNFATVSGLKALILPSITLGLFQLTLIMRLVRSEMLEVMRTDYIKFARARGLSNRAINFGHALKNTLVPVITVAGLQLGALIAFALVTETVFAWPGVGQLFIQSVQFSDIPVMAAYLMLIGLLFVVINLVVDLLYFAVDPRLRGQGGAAKVGGH